MYQPKDGSRGSTGHWGQDGYWGLTFAGASSNDIPFMIDSNGNGLPEFAVYRNGRMTVKNETTDTYWGRDFAGAGIDEWPLAIDYLADGNPKQVMAVYNHVVNMTYAKQILAGKLAIIDYSENKASDTASHSLTSQQLTDLAGGSDTVNLSTRCNQNIPRTTTADPRILQFLTELGAQSGNGISVLFGQCHSSASSLHYKGQAVDLVCPSATATNIALADTIGAKYGIKHNSENCAHDAHLHYSIGGL